MSRHSAPASPCINICVLDGTGHCLGCLRTGDEIARWREMNPAEQWRLIDDLAVRRVLRAGDGSHTPPDGSSDEI